MPHFSDYLGAEDPEVLSRLRIMLRGRAPEPRRLPSVEDRFGLSEPHGAAHDPKDAAEVGPDPVPITTPCPLR